MNEFTRFFYHDLALLGLGGHVCVVTETADPESYFLAADAYALTSRDDPFPCVMLEAMACALPVVAFAGAGGAGEVLSDGCGIIVPYLDVGAMAGHVRSILEQPADFAAMGAKGERRVRSAYRFTDYARQTLDICAELQPVAAERTPLLRFSPRPSMTDISAIRRALEAGVAFLESAQLPSGEIPIELSPTPEMSGDCVREPVVFPAAVAARALSITPSAARVRSRAFDFLRREMHPDGLWRHPSSDKPLHDATPLDVDDTSIASAALAAAGREIPDNRRFLLANRERNGLFRTWIVRWRPHPLLTRRFFRYTAKVRDVDAVVNANVVVYLGICEETRPAIGHMLEVLRANREMMSTIWYGSRFTVWYFFSLALHEIAPEAGEMIVPRIEATAPVNALELALATSTLLVWNRTPDVGPLLDAQLPSGAWPRAGFYHMGQREMDPQPKPPWWGSEALTTVFAVEALSRRLRVEDRSRSNVG